MKKNVIITAPVQTAGALADGLDRLLLEPKSSKPVVKDGRQVVVITVTGWAMVNASLSEKGADEVQLENDFWDAAHPLVNLAGAHVAIADAE